MCVTICQPEFADLRLYPKNGCVCVRLFDISSCFGTRLPAMPVICLSNNDPTRGIDCCYIHSPMQGVVEVLNSSQPTLRKCFYLPPSLLKLFRNLIPSYSRGYSKTRFSSHFQILLSPRLTQKLDINHDQIVLKVLNVVGPDTPLTVSRLIPYCKDVLYYEHFNFDIAHSLPTKLYFQILIVSIILRNLVCSISNGLVV